MDGRYEVTTFQRILVFFAAVGAVFLTAMALGWWNPWLLLAAVATVAAVALSVVTVAVRRRDAMREIAVARVISASRPPSNTGIKAACTMKLAVTFSGGTVEVRHHDPAVDLGRWPARADELWVEVARGNPRRKLRIVWDREQSPADARRAAKVSSQNPDSEYEEQPYVYSPTPPRQRRQSAPPAQTPPVPRTPPPADPVAAAGPPLVDFYEDFKDVDEATLRTATMPGALGPGHDTNGRDTNGHDPNGFDPADFEPPRLEALAALDFDPAEVDRRDFGEAPPAVTMISFDDDPTARAAQERPATIPGPRPAEPSASPGGTGIEASLPVADLARSLRFYRDDLGFDVTYEGQGSAVVEAEGTRILLDQTTRSGVPAPRTRPVHVQVTGIEEICAALRRRGVTFIEPPRPVNDGEHMRLWRARLLDPDGHELAIIEWRHRD